MRVAIARRAQGLSARWNSIRSPRAAANRDIVENSVSALPENGARRLQLRSCRDDRHLGLRKTSGLTLNGERT